MLSLPMRPAAAILSRSAFRNNLKVLRQRIAVNNQIHRRDAQIMAVVKADAYGHELKTVMPEFLKQGIKRFALASISEAIEARSLSRKADLLVLGGTFRWTPAAIEILRKLDLEVAVNDMESLRILGRHRDLKLHLKLDTGMNRLGLKADAWPEALKFIKSQGLRLEGLFTHFATAGDRIFDRQIQIFEEAVRWIYSQNIRPRLLHSENTAAVFSRSGVKKGILSEVTNLVRPGLAFWGYLPGGMKNDFGLQPVLELVSEVGIIKTVDRGEGISYGHHYKAPVGHAYGVVPLGYADGLSKEYAEWLQPQLRTSRSTRKGSLKLCGAICMDMVMVRAMKGKLSAGDRAAFWGRFPNPLLQKHIVEPYELNLRIAKRIPRIWE